MKKVKNRLTKARRGGRRASLWSSKNRKSDLQTGQNSKLQVCGRFRKSPNAPVREELGEGHLEEYFNRAIPLYTDQKTPVPTGAGGRWEGWLGL